jgi:hypothetical protein
MIEKEFEGQRTKEELEKRYQIAKKVKSKERKKKERKKKDAC